MLFYCDFSVLDSAALQGKLKARSLTKPLLSKASVVRCFSPATGYLTSTVRKAGRGQFILWSTESSTQMFSSTSAKTLNEITDI